MIHLTTTMMYWNDDDHPEQVRVSDDVLDLLFAIDCKRIPVDHAYPLARALCDALPWIEDEPGIAVHSIHVAGSQNGWERPQHGTESFLSVPRRARLTVRTPQRHVETLLHALPGTRLEIAGVSLTVGAGKAKSLSTQTTLFARYLALDAPGVDTDESLFLSAAAQQLADLGIRVRKAVCGKTCPLQTPGGPLMSRSLMVAGLTPEESIRLQQRGLGRHPLLGCGIFIPHKGIEAVKPAAP
jgi:CRISPR-associated protein Cas6